MSYELRVKGLPRLRRGCGRWSPVGVAVLLAVAVLSIGARAASDSSGTITAPIGDATTAVGPVIERTVDEPRETKSRGVDMAKAEAEVQDRYAGAHPEIQEYILWTARQFGRRSMWLNEDAFVDLSDAKREKRVQYLATLLSESDYGRHLCRGLAEASALKDERLVPGLMKVAGYQRESGNYDCRPKWIAVSALARQESDQAVPLLISLVDHGNQNTRKWARAALARKTGQDFKEDKEAWRNATGVPAANTESTSSPDLKVSSSSTNSFAWQQKGRYEAPDFDAFFPDDSSGGATLDALWKSKDKDSRKEDEILDTVRSGLRRTGEHRTSILRWIGNKYIWGESPQHPYAIEIMYHAADFSGERADPYGTRHYAVYFGLSVVRPKTPPILRTLVDLCMRIDDPNDLGRVAWGATSQQAELIAYLRPYQESTDPAIRAKAEVCRQIFVGELKAFAWAQDRAKARAEETYTEQLPEIKDTLSNGNTEQRKTALRLILVERLTLIMDDAFIAAFAACSEDADAGVRNSVAKLAGGRWLWSAQKQQPEAISLMLRLSHDESREVRYSAVYYGLSTVRRKSTDVIRRLLEMAFEDREPNLYGRIAWGLSRDQESVAVILEGYINGGDADAAGYAREVFTDMAGRAYVGPHAEPQPAMVNGKLSQWHISEGHFDITNATIEATGTENCIWLTTPYEDFDMRFSATKSAKSDFRVNIGAPSVTTTRRHGFFYQVLIPWEGGDSRVDYFSAGRCTHIKRGFKNIIKPRYDVRMKVEDGVLRVWIDNALHITCPLPNYKKGFIGFGTMTGVRVEDFEMDEG